MVSPIRGDCGDLCGHACCVCDETLPETQKDSRLGIYLLPGEEKLFTRREDWLTWNTDSVEDYDFPLSWSGKIHFVRCNNAPHCVRKLRPIQCRTFPLAPHITHGGVYHVVLNTDELPYVCPLVAERIPLDGRFIRATYTVWKHLIRDPLIADLVRADSLYRGDDVDIVL